MNKFEIGDKVIFTDKLGRPSVGFIHTVDAIDFFGHKGWHYLVRLNHEWHFEGYDENQLWPFVDDGEWDSVSNSMLGTDNTKATSECSCVPFDVINYGCKCGGV